jgi:hypothetical protein
MRRIALLCAVLCLCTTAAVAWGRSVSVRPAASHSSHKTHHKAKKHPTAKKSSKKSSSKKTTAKATASSNAATTAADPVLFGNQTVESSTDNNQAGLAEAFPFSGHISGTAHSIAVYVDSHSTARTVLAALYADSSGRPGSLLASGTLASPKAGAWNTLPISATTVSASKSYWVAVLGKGGTMYFRDRASGPCQSVNSAQTGLSAMPSAWSNGSQWSTCPVSAYISGTATAVLSSSGPTPTTPTTTTTTPTKTTTPPVALPPLPVAPLALTAPQISGTATEGQTLSTDNGTWLDGPTSYAYQWQDCNTSGASCTDISGATASSQALTGADVGHTVRVVVTATNSGGSTPSTSSQTAIIAAQPAPTNTAAPTVSGTATQGQTLTAAKGTWTGSPTSYAYQWQDCSTSGASCTNISGATSSTYTLAAGDVGHTARSVVTATNDGGSAAASSQPTATVASSTPPPPAAPTNTTAPSISGTATQGQTLTAAKGTWTGSPTSYAYEWQDCSTSGTGCTNISGATSSTYTLAAGDVGHTARVAVTATNSGGSASGTSSQTATVASSAPPPPAAPVNTAKPAISGTTQQGGTVTVSDGSWSGDTPMTFAYQWMDCNQAGVSCTNIPGATSNSYTLQSSDLNDTVAAAVTASNDAGSASATSNASPVVTAPTTCGGNYRCFYISYTNGNNSNSGASTASPWKEAPGMKGFSASYSHQAGDHFIFEGGDTWPASVFPMNVASSGTSSNGDYYGAGDKSWHTGSSWSQPTFDAQSNTSLGSFVSFNSGVSYVTFDDIHFTNFAWANDPGYGGSDEFDMSNNTKNISLINSLIDHWTHTGKCCDDSPQILGGDTAQNYLIQGNTVDQSPTTYDSGWGVYGGDSGTIDNNTFYNMEQALNPFGNNVISNNKIYNIGQDQFPDYDGSTHTNAINVQGGNDYIFNNLIDNIGQGTMTVNWQAEGNTYVFNNVVWNVCGTDFCRYGLQPDCTWGGCTNSHTYIFNNTLDADSPTKGSETSVCIRWTARSGDGSGGANTYSNAVIENNHCIGTGLNTMDSGVTITNLTQNNNLTESQSTATSQGYTSSNNYAPTSASSPTVGAGLNLTSQCSGETQALCTGFNGKGRPGSGSWDIGAYEF